MGIIIGGSGRPRIQMMFGGAPIDVLTGDPNIGFIRRNEQPIPAPYDAPPVEEYEVIDLPVNLKESSLRIESRDGVDFLEVEYALSEKSVESEQTVILHFQCWSMEENPELQTLEQLSELGPNQTVIEMNEEVLRVVFPDQNKKPKSLYFRSNRKTQISLPKGETEKDKTHTLSLEIGDFDSLSLKKVLEKEENREEENENDENEESSENMPIFRHMKYYPLVLEIVSPSLVIYLFLDQSGTLGKNICVSRRSIKIPSSQSSNLQNLQNPVVEEIEGEENHEEEEEQEETDRRKLLESTQEEKEPSSQVRNKENESIVFECDEIFGILNNDGENVCVICLSEESDTVLNPCLHLCCCFGCSRTLTVDQQSKSCPICRSNIESIFQIPTKRQAQ